MYHVLHYVMGETHHMCTSNLHNACLTHLYSMCIEKAISITHFYSRRMNRCPVHMDIYYKHNTRTEWAHYNGHKEGSGSFPLFAEEVPYQHQLGFLLLVFWERPCITDVSSGCMAYSLPFFK